MKRKIADLHARNVQDLLEQAEKRQRELSTYLHSLISVIEDIIFEIDGNQVFLNVWVRDESILFMPKDQFLGKTIKAVFGSQSALFLQPVEEALRTGAETSVEYQHMDPSVKKWYRAKVVPVEKSSDPDSYRLALIIQDITERVQYLHALKEAQAKLARNNQLLDFSQQLSATGGWEYDVGTGQTFWTKQAYSIYEVQDDFDVSDPAKYLSFFSEEDRAKINTHMQQCIDEQREYVFEMQAQVSPHRKKWVRVLGVPIIEEGRVTALRGAVMDITREKEDALTLLTAKELAEHATKAKSDFLSVMSHEIRTPLNGIIGIANLLKLKHSKEQAELVDNLLFSADHLLQLINDILDLNKMESNKLELNRTELDLATLVRSIRNQFSSLAEAKSIRLISLLDQEIPGRLIGDPIRLSQILNNLVSNAVKYTDRGNVTLSIQVAEQNTHSITLHFSVKDTGIGISEELHEAIFEDFRQLQQDSHRTQAGTGLGLAITRRLIELHNSQIYLDSRPGKGSEFYFDLTFDLPDAAAAAPVIDIAPHLSAFEGKLGALKLLLVEDNRVNTIVTRDQLAYFGIDAHCAVGGQEALALLKHNTYHVAFVDLHMPGMDGYSLAAQMREQYPDVRIVIFTADIMSNVRIKLAKMGIHDILNKPFIPEEMLRILLDTMKEKKL